MRGWEKEGGGGGINWPNHGKDEDESCANSPSIEFMSDDEDGINDENCHDEVDRISA